jgi:hypothetical protein
VRGEEMDEALEEPGERELGDEGGDTSAMVQAGM